MDFYLVGSIVCFSLLTYLVLVYSLRLRRMNQEINRLLERYPDIASLARMTNGEAHYVIKYLQQYEFPFAFACSLAASLHRPCGIPSISCVLAKTKQFANLCRASERSAGYGSARS